MSQLVTDHRKGYLFAFAAALLWGSTATATKMLLADLDEWAIVFYMNVFATAGVLAVAGAIPGKFALIRSVSRRDLFALARLGTVGVFLYSLCLIGALARLPAQEAFTLNYLWPLMAILFAVPILGDSFRARTLAGAVVAFLGVAVVILRGEFSELSFTSLSGATLAIAGAVFYGIFSVFGKKRSDDPIVAMFYCYLIASVFSGVLLLGTSGIPPLRLAQVAGFVWLGSIVSGIGFIFWFLSLKYGDIAKVSAAAFLTPFFSLAYAAVFLGEQMLSSSLLGLALIIGGIMIIPKNVKSDRFPQSTNA